MLAVEILPRLGMPISAARGIAESIWSAVEKA